MKKFSKLLALLMALLMVVPMSAEMFVFADTPAAADESQSAEEETVELPSSCTLVGTTHLPPISNQGEVGSCASNAITWTQYTNAVSRYLHSINPDIKWDPSSGSGKYIFSPKFTFQYSSAGTSWVYDILMAHGCLTLSDCNFATNENGSFRIHVPGRKKIEPKTAGFEVSEGLLKKALGYRLTGYEQIWIAGNNGAAYKSGGKTAITTTEAGQKLITKIKDALVRGNVVVTGGYPSRWQFSADLGVRLSSTGTLAKTKGETAILYSVGESAGGHQVCIVGYDDDIAVTYKGVTLKGAFLVSNSWGTEWKNNGYVWMMYDALNEVSQYDELNVPGRIWTMDQMCFVYWDKDVTTELPDLMLEVEVETNNRDGAAIGIVRKSTDENGKTSEEHFFPAMFDYGPINKDMHTTYDTKDTFTYSGKVFTADSPLEKGYYTLNLNAVSSKGSDKGGYALEFPEGKSFADYEWGVRLYGCLGATTIYKSVKLVTKTGTVIAELDVGADGYTAPMAQKAKSEIKYFDFKGTSLTEIKLPAGSDAEGYEISLPNGKYVKTGDSYSFTIAVEDGYSMDNAVVTVNGQTLTQTNGVYTVNATGSSDVIAVTGVAKAGENGDSGENSGNGETSEGKGVSIAGMSVALFCGIAGGAVVVIAAVVIVVVVSKKKKNSTK